MKFKRRSSAIRAEGAAFKRNGIPEGQEVVRTKVCRTCGASYSTPGVSQGHTRATGHNDWKTVKSTRPKEPSRISYQPGYGPKE